MINGPLTTVVIPAFNAAEFLERTLSSVRQQTYRSLEIIVVDDGSTDDTAEIAAAAALLDSRVRTIHVRNGGVARARNHGIQAATGQFVALLDADDLWHPTKVQRQVEALCATDSLSCGAAYSRMRIIDEDDQVIRNGSGVGSTGSSFARHLYARPVGNGSSILVRRSVALEVGGYDPSWMDRGIGGCEDLDFELKVVALYPMVALPQYLVGYRSHSNNMSSNALALARSVTPVVEKHILSHPEMGTWAAQKSRASAVEFALQSLATAGEWKLFFEELLHLREIDGSRGMEYAVRFAVRKLVRDWLQLRPAAPSYEDRPLFYDLDPDDDAGLTFRPPRFRDKKILRQLAEVDLVCSKRMAAGAAREHETAV